MVFGWLKPNKLKIILFIIITAMLFYMPMVPTLSTPVILSPTYEWNLKSPAYSVQSMEIMGVSNQYFGAFTGMQGATLNVVYILVVSYVISCALVSLFHKSHTTEHHTEQHTGQQTPAAPQSGQQLQ